MPLNLGNNRLGSLILCIRGPYLAQWHFPPKLVPVARQLVVGGLMCMVEMALGASNPSRHMVYSVEYIYERDSSLYLGFHAY